MKEYASIGITNAPHVADVSFVGRPGGNSQRCVRAFRTLCSCRVCPASQHHLRHHCRRLAVLAGLPGVLISNPSIYFRRNQCVPRPVLRLIFSTPLTTTMNVRWGLESTRRGLDVPSSRNRRRQHKVPRKRRKLSARAVEGHMMITMMTSSTTTTTMPILQRPTEMQTARGSCRIRLSGIGYRVIIALSCSRM